MTITIKYGLVILTALAAATVAPAAQIYFQGFETDTSGWVPDTGGTTTGTITQVPSGTGGIAAADGSYYAQVTNSDNSYLAGYGTGGYTLFGGNNTSGSPFFESIDVYIDPYTSLAGTNSSIPEFWIDASPSSTDPYDVANNGGTGYGGEQNFQLYYNGSSVSVGATGGPSIATITTAGWYDFEFLYSQSDSNPADISDTTLSIAAAGGSVLGSTTLENDSDGETLENQYLAGPGYLWLPVWQNGFSGDTLDIDDVQAGTVTPEPSSVILLGAGILALGLLARRRRTA